MNMPKEVTPKKENFPNKRKNLMKMIVEKEKTQYWLAKQVGLTSVQVNRIVNGKSNGSMKFWEDAARILDCEVSDIL